MAKPIFTIREARLPDDKPVLLDFIMSLQHFERALESNRRIDPAVAEEYFAVTAKRVDEQNGRMLIAEDAARTPLGWAAAHEGDDEVFVVSEQRRTGYIAELFVVEDARGRGIGKALITACEAWGRERGLPIMTIGVLYNNVRAFGTYQKAGYRPYAAILKKPLA